MQNQRQRHRRRLFYAATTAGFLLLSIWAIQPNAVLADGKQSISQANGVNGTIPVPTAPTATPIATAPADHATITIVKDAEPNSIQDFVFFGPTGKFTLDDDSGVGGADDEFGTSQTISVPAGSYTISEAMHPSWYLAEVNCSIAGTELTQRTLSLTVAAGDDVTCTFVNQRRVEILANVFLDSDGDGDKDAGEAALSGFEIRLYNADESLNQRFVSDADGQVTFTRRIPGNYDVCILLHSADGSDNSKDDLTINNPDLRCQSVSLQPGEFAEVNFGLTAQQAGTVTPTSTPIATAPATPTAVSTAPATPTATSTPIPTEPPDDDETPTTTPTPEDDDDDDDETPTTPTPKDDDDDDDETPTTPTPEDDDDDDLIYSAKVQIGIRYGQLPDINEAPEFPVFMPLVTR